MSWFTDMVFGAEVSDRKAPTGDPGMSAFVPDLKYTSNERLGMLENLSSAGIVESLKIGGEDFDVNGLAGVRHG